VFDRGIVRKMFLVPPYGRRNTARTVPHKQGRVHQDRTAHRRVGKPLSERIHGHAEGFAQSGSGHAFERDLQSDQRGPETRCEFNVINYQPGGNSQREIGVQNVRKS